MVVAWWRESVRGERRGRGPRRPLSSLPSPPATLASHASLGAAGGCTHTRRASCAAGEAARAARRRPPGSKPPLASLPFPKEDAKPLPQSSYTRHSSASGLSSQKASRGSFLAGAAAFLCDSAAEISST